MLKIEIGQWEGGQKIGLTFECDKQTNRQRLLYIVQIKAYVFSQGSYTRACKMHVCLFV